MPCFLLILMGCTNRKTSKEFTHIMDDGSSVVVKIEYKPNSQIDGNEKFGSYYYIVQYLTPEHVERGSGEQQVKTKTIPPNTYIGINIGITFYDRRGYSLFRTEDIFGGKVSKFIPAAYACEINKIVGGGWEWKGQFDESKITIENFRQIHSQKVTYYPPR